MSRRLILTIVVVLAFAGSAFAQRGAEAFGGYSYQRTSDQGLNGFNGAVTGNMTSWMGLTGEFSLHSYGTSVVSPTGLVNADAKLMGFRFGPKFTSHMNDTTSVFVHVLAGAYRASMDVSATAPGFNLNANASGTGFSTAAGGGVDFRISPRIGLRPAQLDWIYLGSMNLAGVDTGHSNAFRYSGGVVVRF